MASEKRLSEVLKEFAHTLLTDMPAQAILDGLVDRIVEVLPITSAGLTLIVPGAAPEYVAASDAAALRYERLQTEVREGPCLTAYESGEAVAVPDLCCESRFPTFCAQAVAAGLRAVFTFPLYNGGERVGALDLYRETPGPLSAAALDAVATLADVAAVYLFNAKTRHELQELDRTQNDFVSTVSHELRSPLTSIIGYLEVLIDGAPGPINDEQRDILAIVERNGHRLLELIEDLLAVARADAQGQELHIQTVDLRAIVKRVCETTGPAVVKADLTLLVDLEPQSSLEGDCDELERALLNLVSNAIKFTPRGGRIEILTRAEGDDIALSVHDNGTGIPKEEQHQLFTRFFRSRLANSQQVPGTGLGLYIVNHVVELHGGVMKVASTPEGSTFTMVLPTKGPLSHQNGVARCESVFSSKPTNMTPGSVQRVS